MHEFFNALSEQIMKVALDYSQEKDISKLIHSFMTRVEIGFMYFKKVFQ